MIDLHTHILPGVDDGAPDLETSVLMAAVAAESGVTHLVATPHSNQRGAFENYASQALQVRFDCLCAAVREAGIPLELSLGMEIFGTGDVPQLLREGRLLTINGGRYLLIEFGFHEDPLRIERLLDQLLAAGYWPVVAHAERYYVLQRMPNYLYDWVNRGVVLQVNKGSLFGRFGRGAQALARAMLTHGLVGCIALSGAFERVCHFGRAFLRASLRAAAHAQSRIDPAQRTAACRPLPAVFLKQ